MTRTTKGEIKNFLLSTLNFTRDEKNKLFIFEKMPKVYRQKIKFHYNDDREADIFTPTHIATDFGDDELLLWDNQCKWCTLDYAIKNQIR